MHPEPVRCERGHSSPAGSRFCVACGLPVEADSSSGTGSQAPVQMSGARPRGGRWSRPVLVVLAACGGLLVVLTGLVVGRAVAGNPAPVVEATPRASGGSTSGSPSPTAGGGRFDCDPADPQAVAPEWGATDTDPVCLRLRVAAYYCLIPEDAIPDLGVEAVLRAGEDQEWRWVGDFGEIAFIQRPDAESGGVGSIDVLCPSGEGIHLGPDVIGGVAAAQGYADLPDPTTGVVASDASTPAQAEVAAIATACEPDAGSLTWVGPNGVGENLWTYTARGVEYTARTSVLSGVVETCGERVDSCPESYVDDLTDAQVARCLYEVWRDGDLGTAPDWRVRASEEAVRWMAGYSAETGWAWLGCERVDPTEPPVPSRDGNFWVIGVCQWLTPQATTVTMHLSGGASIGAYVDWVQDTPPVQPVRPAG